MTSALSSADLVRNHILIDFYQLLISELLLIAFDLLLLASRFKSRQKLAAIFTKVFKIQIKAAFGATKHAESGFFLICKENTSRYEPLFYVYCDKPNKALYVLSTFCRDKI